MDQTVGQLQDRVAELEAENRDLRVSLSMIQSMSGAAVARGLDATKKHASGFGADTAVGF